MKQNINAIEINGTKYVPQDSIGAKAPTSDGLEYVICRTYSAGVFAGYLKERNGQEVTLLNARRIWYWTGAASLSQLAIDGTSSPATCKFPVEVEKIELLQVIEILTVSQKAFDSIKNVPVWKL